MSIYRGPYLSATSCRSAPRQGTYALVSWYVGAYRSRGAAGLGTYSCKRLGSGWSIHAERRAADLGTVPYGGVDSDWGWKFANALRLNSAELGIQCIILGHWIWSCMHPDAGWRSYHGQHHGHAHVELTSAASYSLTAERIEATIGGGASNMFVKYGASRDAVKYLQYRLHNLGFAPGSADGDYGDLTKTALAAAVKSYNGKIVDGKTYGPTEMIYLDVLWTRKYGQAGPVSPR